MGLALGRARARRAARRPPARSRWRRCARSTSGWRRSGTGSRSPTSDWCAERAWLPGLAVHDLSQYGADFRPAAIRAFGLDAGPGVLALAAGGPAERAGLRADDILLALDGRPPPRGAPGRGGSFDADGAHPRRPGRGLRRRPRDDRGPARRRAADVIEVAAEQGCATRFQLIPGRSLNARADGRLRPAQHRDRRICRRRRRAGRRARPRIRAQCARPPRAARPGAGAARLPRQFRRAMRGGSARPRSRRTGSASI